MTTLIFAALALYLVQLFTPSLVRIPQIGVDRYVGSRDNLPELPVIGQRAQRALENMKESLLLFLPLAILTIVQGVEAQAMLGAQIYLVARIVYAVCYLLAVPWLRSIVWTVGLVGLIMMALPLFG